MKECNELSVSFGDCWQFFPSTCPRTHSRFAKPQTEAKGITFVGEPQDQSWGTRMVSFRDPDGNNLYLLEWLDN